jgi:hypothetical protein
MLSKAYKHGVLERDGVRLGVGVRIVTKVVTGPDHWFACHRGAEKTSGEFQVGLGTDIDRGAAGWRRTRATDRFGGPHISTAVFLPKPFCSSMHVKMQCVVIHHKYVTRWGGLVIPVRNAYLTSSTWCYLTFKIPLIQKHIRAKTLYNFMTSKALPYNCH